MKNDPKMGDIRQSSSTSKIEIFDGLDWIEFVQSFFQVEASKLEDSSKNELIEHIHRHFPSYSREFISTRVISSVILTVDYDCMKKCIMIADSSLDKFFE